jgi:Rrf2 family protein
MVDIGENYDKGPVSLRELAGRQDISMRYMEQIVPSLKAAGLVRSIRGAKGGYVLEKSPRDISLREIIHALEGPWSIVDCVDDESLCSRTQECATYDIWQYIHDAVHRVLDETTLEDMIVRHREKKKNGAMIPCPSV